ncbi:MAG: hypothetical protein CFE46_14290 [Burkholderiales bacterium PBB6]|nr:MAG: hypothetical protein CFE46_14290 [Burkholderiales bacterium PBB6]
MVTNSAGSVTSSAATLTVTTTDGSTVPTISSQPASLSVAAGASASFSVTATGSGTLAYQWFKDGTAISGATAATYSVSSTTSSDAGSYTVTVSNSAGSVTSSAAVLTVTVTTSSSSALAADATTAAQAFIATLSSSQQSSVQLSWNLTTARQWSNLPASMVSRNGLAWKSLSTAQQTAARALIATALSSSGNTLHQGMQAADDALVSLYGASSSTYGSGNYYIAFVGTPSATGYWLLQLTGHHLTYNIAFNGTVKSPTPLFLGVEPKGSFTLNGTTWDPMLAQRTAVSELGAVLTSYSGALLSGTYSDLLFGANGSGGIDGTYPKSYPTTNRGLAYSSLSAADQAKVQAVITAYVNTQATEYADDLLGAYLSSTALAQTYVAYSGTGTVTSNGNYFRIDGPRVWIEFSVQRGVIISSDIHFHTIWRDKTGDYGGKCCS